MKKIRYFIILVLFLLSLISSIILSTKSASEICNASNGCEIVYYSQYNSLFGISNSYYGIIIFGFLSLFTIYYLTNPSFNKKIFLNLSILAGSLVALFFLYVQSFILNTFCRYCLVIDISIILALLLILPELKESLSHIKGKKNTIEYS